LILVAILQNTGKPQIHFRNDELIPKVISPLDPCGRCIQQEQGVQESLMVRGSPKLFDDSAQIV